MRQGLSIELVAMASLTSQLDLGIPFVCLLRLELQPGCYVCLAFSWIARDPNSGPHACIESSNHCAIFPDPQVHSELSQTLVPQLVSFVTISVSKLGTEEDLLNSFRNLKTSNSVHPHGTRGSK